MFHFLEGKYLYKLFGILLTRKFASSLPLGNLFIISLYQYELMIILH